MLEPTSALSIPDTAAGVKIAGVLRFPQLGLPPHSSTTLCGTSEDRKTLGKKTKQTDKEKKKKGLWVNAKLSPHWRKESRVLCYKLGTSPEMLLGFSARVRTEPRAAGSCLSLSACPWEVLLGFSARVRADPRPAGACFPLPCCPLEVIPKMGLEFSASARQSPELLVLVFTFLLVLGQGWKLSCSVFQAKCTPGICWDLWSWGRAVLWSSCNQAVAFHCFRDRKISGVLKSLGTSLSDSG